MKSILDPSFRYVPSHATDVRTTFERLRRERETTAGQLADTVVQINAKEGAAGVDRSLPTFLRAARSR